NRPDMTSRRHFLSAAGRWRELSVVIPGRREAADPESSRSGGSRLAGFRARACGAPRNDGLGAVALAERGLAGIGHLDPSLIGGGARHVAVVPVPPLVGPALRIAVRRLLPFLLAAECRHVEVAPHGAHRLVAAAVDEVGAVDALAVADEGVVAVPLVDAEVDVE